MSSTHRSMRPLSRLCLLIATLAAVQACTRDATEEKQSADSGTTNHYNWYMEGSTPAGETTIVDNGDGLVTNETSIHWNNREYTLESEVRLDDDGMIAAQRITGNGPFGAPIDEEFSIDGDMATWHTAGDQGSAIVESPAFYLASESAAYESLALLVRAAHDRIDGALPLLPGGTAVVTHVLDVDTEEAGEDSASLYAVSGIDFTPEYVWLDENLNLLAIDIGGYLGMVPAGWSPETLAGLSAAQSRASAEYIAALAGDLARETDGPVVFANVDVMDVENGVLLEAHSVKVADGRIAEISAEPIDTEGAIVIDGEGKTLMPGMWDMHGHFSLSDGVLNVAGGITSVRDIGGVHEKTIEMTGKFDSGKVIGPHTYRAGFMDKTGPYASGWAAATLEEALEQVDFYAANGYIQIKLYSSIEPDWVEPIAERAHEHGMRLSGHIPAFMSAEQAVRAGYDEIQHINMVFLNFLAGDREDTRKQIRFTLYGDAAADLDLDSEEVGDFIALLKENDVVVDPTAAIFDTMLRHTTGEPDPTYAAVIDHLPPAVSRPLYNPEMVLGEAWPLSAGKQNAMLRKLHENGVQLVPGSDNIAAFTVHRELEVYSEAGIPNAAVLRIATLDSARVTGVDDRTGSIAVGKDSDLVLLDGNPLEDISAVRRATLVMKGSTLYRPDELYRAVGVKPFVPSSEI